MIPDEIQSKYTTPKKPVLISIPVELLERVDTAVSSSSHGDYRTRSRFMSTAAELLLSMAADDQTDNNNE